ncbi:MAG: protein kinase [Thermoleophilia bacterium]
MAARAGNPASQTVEDRSPPPGAAAFEQTSIGGFVIEGEAGRGGMGVVHRAREPRLDRRVALKIMAPALSSDARFRQLFEDESRRAAALEHPNVLPVYGSGDEAGQLYIAMRFVEDGSLQDLVERRGALPPGMAVRIVGRVADALDAAHAHGLVHRDVKPGNVLVADPGGPDEQVYLSDFGLAMPVDEARGGAGGGTPGYLAPEQLAGGAVGPWTDVYALGCLLDFALTGRAPSRAALAEHGAAAGDLAGLPAGLAEVIARATAPRADDRYPSAGALARAASAVRRDVVLVHHPDDREAADRLEGRLRARGVDARASDQAGDDLSVARACLVLVGRAGLDGWARDALSAAREVTATDPAFVLGTVLLPGAPDLLEPALAALASRPAVDLRGEPDDPHAVSDVLRLLGAAPARHGTGSVAGCPYRGLAAFGEEDAELFVGRERETAMLLAKLRGGRFLAVLGASGTGKSSLIRAGLLPALRAAEPLTAVCTLTPGRGPAGSLAAALAPVLGARAPSATDVMDDPRSLDRAGERAADAPDAPRRLVVVVDQFEEVFSLTASPRERRAFIDALVHAATVPGGDVVVVLAMRSDFYGRCAEHPELRALVADRQFLVGPLGPAALQRAIEEPAAVAGLTLEDGLTRRILADVTSQPGALPLMEHLLLELWERRRGTFLTLQAYEECGGVGGAVARTANEVYGGFSPEQRAIARRVLLRLTQPGEGSEDTRRRAEVAELATSPAEEPAVGAILEAMSAARLVTLATDPATGAPTAEVTHEALIRGWPELRSWIDEDREQLRLHRRLTDAAGEWDAAGRDDALLYRGSRLDAWSGRPEDDLNARERAFLEAGRGREAREQSARRRRLRLTVGALTAGVVALAVLAALALVSRGQARTEATAAREDASRALAAQSRLAASSGGDPFTLAQRSLSEARTPEGAEALRLAVQQPLRRSIPTGHGGLWALAPLSDGRILTGSESGQVEIWDPAAPGHALASVATGHSSVYVLLELPDGRLVSGHDDGTLAVWDRSLGTPLASVQTGHGSVYGGALLPGDRIAIGSGDGWIQIRDAKDLSRTLGGFPTRHTAIDALTALPGGLLAVGSDDGWLQVFDPGRPSRPVASADTGHGAVYSIERLPGGRLAVGGDPGWVDIWRVGPPLVRLATAPTRQGTTWSVVPLDAHRLAVASDDSTLDVRPIDHPERVIQRIPADHGPLLKAVLPAGGGLATGSNGGQLQVWDLTESAPPLVSVAKATGTAGDEGAGGLATLGIMPRGRIAIAGTGRLTVLDGDDPTHPLVRVETGLTPTRGLAVLPGGRVALLGGVDLQIWDPLRHDRPVGAGTIGTADGMSLARIGGDRLVTTDAKGMVAVWNPADLARPVARWSSRHGRVWGILPLADERFATLADDGTMTFWDASRPGTPEATFEAGHGPMFAAATLPDGRIVTASGGDGKITIWDPADPTRPVTSWTSGHSTVFALAVLPDGRVVTGSTDGQIQAWDPARHARPLASIATTGGSINEMGVLGDGRLVTGSGGGRLEIRSETAFLSQSRARQIADGWPLTG